MKKGYLPQDIFPDDKDFICIGDEAIRKGTMGAFLANLNVIENQGSSECDRNVAWKAIISLLPAIKASGLLLHVSWKNKKLRALFNQLET